MQLYRPARWAQTHTRTTRLPLQRFPLFLVASWSSTSVDCTMCLSGLPRHSRSLIGGYLCALLPECSVSLILHYVSIQNMHSIKQYI